jgi:hypothetical protein
MLAEETCFAFFQMIFSLIDEINKSIFFDKMSSWMMARFVDRLIGCTAH